MPKKNTLNKLIYNDNSHDQQLWQLYQNKVTEKLQGLDKTNNHDQLCGSVSEVLVTPAEESIGHNKINLKHQENDGIQKRSGKLKLKNKTEK